MMGHHVLSMVPQLIYLLVLLTVSDRGSAESECGASRTCSTDKLCATTPLGNKCIPHTTVPCQTDQDCQRLSLGSADSPLRTCFLPQGAVLGYCGGCDVTSDCNSQGTRNECTRESDTLIFGGCTEVSQCSSDSQCLDIEFCDLPPLADMNSLAHRGVFTRQCRTKLARNRPCSRDGECWNGRCFTRGRGFHTVGKCL